MKNSLSTDLNHILDHTRGLWEELRGERIFISGGTGFFGCWLLESFIWANEKLNLGASALVLTRNPEAFRAKAAHLYKNPALEFLVGDIRSFNSPPECFSHVIHAATTSSEKQFEIDRIQMFDTIVSGTRRALELARQCGTRKFLLTSSGAVYGKQPPEMTHIPEQYTGGPATLDLKSAYGEGKRAAELLSIMYASQYGFEAKIARCFAFVGPYLPLDSHYAIGNFIRDGLNGGPIMIKGNGTPQRSYIYAADLVIWLWTILFRGSTCEAYNVGGEVNLTIEDAARQVSECFSPKPNIHIQDSDKTPHSLERYVPSTAKARMELGLIETVALQDAIKQTIIWESKSRAPILR